MTLSKEAIWRRLDKIRPIWEAAYAAQDWDTAQRCKRIYDRLWTRWDRKAN